LSKAQSQPKGKAS